MMRPAGVPGPGPGPAQMHMPMSWAEHFPPSEFSSTDKRATLIQHLVGTFLAQDGWRFIKPLQRTCEGGWCLELDYKELLAAFTRAVNTPDLQLALGHQPTDALACVAIAVQEVRHSACGWVSILVVAQSCRIIQFSRHAANQNRHSVGPSQAKLFYLQTAAAC